jgi:hypothetical protein
LWQLNEIYSQILIIAVNYVIFGMSQKYYTSCISNLFDRLFPCCHVAVQTRPDQTSSVQFSSHLFSFSAHVIMIYASLKEWHAHATSKHKFTKAYHMEKVSYETGTRGSFPGSIAAEAWSWSLIYFPCWGLCMELYFHSPIQPHDMILI